MLVNRKYKLFLLLLASPLFFPAGAAAQSKTDKSLFDEIIKQDSVLFTAFNTRNVEVFTSMFTTDLEFYHDKGGLTGYDHTVNFMKEVAKPGNDLHRELVKETVEVFPIGNYGAVQIGQHRFCHTENKTADCGTFRFVHIWQLKDGAWKIARIISYDH